MTEQSAEKQNVNEKKVKEKKKPNLTSAVGRRKSSVARVYVREGSGKIRVNRRTFDSYFPRESHRLIIHQPIKLASLESRLDIYATVNGGGTTGQAHALRHGISRAIVKLEEGKRSIIKKAGLLTRDPRAKERKKPGLKRARKAPQYTKR